MSIPILTIDGPSGAGKGTVSRAVAQRLAWHYLDSGSIYRSLAIAALANNIETHNIEGLVTLAQNMRLEFECTDELIVKLDGMDISAKLALESTGNIASIVAVYPQVRAALLQKQKDFQRKPGLVADGRDMGTIVFPQAENKVFLTASAKERAKRRYKQLIEKGINANLVQITEEIEARDHRDQQRATAPLMMADNALYIDSSHLSIEQVIEEVLNLVH